MNAFPSSERPEPAGDLTEIIRLIRRICLFREQGESAQAARLHAGPLVTAITAYRLWHGPDSLTDETLCRLFVDETEHVREAMTLAEVVAPQLAKLFRPSPAGPRDESATGGAAPGGSVRPFPTASPAITELLDAMIASERPTRDRRANGPQ